SSSGTRAAATGTSTACPVGGATQAAGGIVGVGNDSGEGPAAGGGGDNGLEAEQTAAGDATAAALGAGMATACAQEVVVDEVTANAEDVCTAEEGPVTPGRPRPPPAHRLDGNDASTAENGGASEDGGDGYAVADETCPSEEGSQTPSSSGAGFDYFPTGFSQATDSEQADRRGVTAADMLNFQRSLREELPDQAKTAIPSPAKPAPSPPPPQPPPSKKEALPSPPPSSRRPPGTGWVPNPYETGVGSLLTPRRKRSEPKALPASPFAIAADAAARRVEAAAKREAAAAAAAAAAAKKTTTARSDRTMAAAARGVAGAASPSVSRPLGSSRQQHASSARGEAAAPSPSPASVHQHPMKPRGGCGDRDPRASQSAGPSAAGKPPNPPSHRRDQRKPSS
ncbi:unnamed protein product, partial [Ectocarpus fasciculatus]